MPVSSLTDGTQSPRSPFPFRESSSTAESEDERSRTISDSAHGISEVSSDGATYTTSTASAAPRTSQTTPSRSTKGHSIPGSPQVLGPASVYECIVCTRLPDHNRVCPRCRGVFCIRCLEAWWREGSKAAGSVAIDGGGTCPTCRLEAPAESFLHDALVQEEVDKAMVRCECGVQYCHGQRMSHRCSALQECPFPGCDYTASPRDLETHTAQCSRAVRYSMSLMVQTVLDNSTAKSESVNLSDATYAKILKEASAARAAAAEAPPGPEGSVRHYIQMSDTLSGLAVKYETSTQEIKRLNRLTEDIFSRQWIWVPRPSNYQPEQLDVPSIEAMVALRKRQIVQDVMAASKAIGLEEAVSYLQLTEWSADKAIRQLREDEAWERRVAAAGATAQRPQTLKEFLVQCHKRERRRQDSLTSECCCCNETSALLNSEQRVGAVTLVSECMHVTLWLDTGREEHMDPELPRILFFYKRRNSFVACVPIMWCRCLAVCDTRVA
eukprot:m.1387756 g.1387756  ORF g.1387756 m.1387756 type:complete len:496 (+) comp24984_c0_seq5:207-1694(+)